MTPAEEDALITQYVGFIHSAYHEGIRLAIRTAYAKGREDERERADANAKDAGRYRYLRSRNKDEVFDNDGIKAGVWIDCTDEDGTLQLLTFEDADAAIDAALRKGE